VAHELNLPFPVYGPTRVDGGSGLGAAGQGSREGRAPSLTVQLQGGLAARDRDGLDGAGRAWRDKNTSTSHFAETQHI